MPKMMIFVDGSLVPSISSKDTVQVIDSAEMVAVYFIEIMKLDIVIVIIVIDIIPFQKVRHVMAKSVL